MEDLTLEGTTEEKKLVNDAFVLVDPRFNSPLRKSEDDFLSISPNSGQVTFSRHLARAMGFMSGDRLAFITHKENEYLYLIYKTTQYQNTLEVKLSRGNYSFNSKKYVQMIGGPFRFDQMCQTKIRMYVDFANPIVVQLPGKEKICAYQLYDIPVMRTDFGTESERLEYIAEMKATNYIIKNQNKKE